MNRHREYQDLLRVKPGLARADRVFRLYEDLHREVLPGSQASESLRQALVTAGVLDPPSESGSPPPLFEVPPSLSSAFQSRLRERNRDLADASRRPLPRRHSDERIRLSALCHAGFLAFSHDYGKLAEAHPGLVEVAALVFESSLGDLLPELWDRRMEPEAIRLLNLMYHYSDHCALAEEQSAWMKAQVFYEVDDHERALHFLKASLALGEPGDEDYLTKVQAGWTWLIQRNLLREAQQFVLDYQEAVSPSGKAQIAEMDRITLDLALKSHAVSDSQQVAES